MKIYVKYHNAQVLEKKQNKSKTKIEYKSLFRPVATFVKNNIKKKCHYIGELQGTTITLTYYIIINNINQLITGNLVYLWVQPTLSMLYSLRLLAFRHQNLLASIFIICYLFITIFILSFQNDIYHNNDDNIARYTLQRCQILILNVNIFSLIIF